MAEKKVIQFYSTKGPYGFMSNFSRHPITVAGKVYPTSEHFYQSCKYVDVDEAYEEKIRLADTPTVAAKLGRDKAHPMRGDWDQVKDEVAAKKVVDIA